MKLNNTKLKVIGLGAGGHARVVIDILCPDSKYEIVGLLDSNSKLHNQEVFGLPVLGDDEVLLNLLPQGVEHFFVGLGGVGDNRPRRRLFELALQHGLEPVEAIHSRACISPSANIGRGVTVMAGAVINACATIGINVIVNTGCIIEHDCVVCDHVHIASGAILASTVKVGEGAHIGAGATVRQCIDIGERAIVGAGAVVVEDVPADTTVVGVPARPKG